MSEDQHLITLQRIRDNDPCEDSWKALLCGLNTRNLATKLTVADVAVINTVKRGVELGVQDAFWCLRCIDDPRLRVRAIMPAVKRASSYTQDPCVHACITDIERWLGGDDSVDLGAVQTAAWAAVAAAAYARREAGSAAGESAAWAVSLVVDAATTIWPEESADWAACAARRVREAGSAAEKTTVRRNAELAEYHAQLDDLITLFGLYAARNAPNCRNPL